MIQTPVAAQNVYLEYGLWALLGLFMVVAVIALWKSHKDQSKDFKNFNLLDLITTSQGTINRPAVMELVVFVLMGWGFIVYVARGTLSEWYAGLLVGAFVLRAAYSSFLSSKKPANGQSPPAEVK